MGEHASAMHGADIPDTARASAPAAPRWLHAIDTACIVVLNLGLAAEVVIVFLNTVMRPFHLTLMPGMEETARLLLICLAFLGGGVAYGRGQFMAITIAVDRLPRRHRAYPLAAVQWAVAAIAAVIGGSSIPLQLLNAGAHTTLLGISFIWMTMPMTIGCAILILHAGVALLRLPPRAVIVSGCVVTAAVLALIWGQDGAWIDTPVFYAVLVSTFVLLIAIGVPVGFVLSAVGIIYVTSTGAAPLVAIATNAQRGTGGFIFLALPFFILAGFIMDRGGIGARIVSFLTALIGHVRGGLLQVSIVGMYIASGISGAKAADMAAVGIPMNKSFRQQGYDPAEAAAVLASSAAMGESIPPSIAILALGSVTSVSTAALFLAGLVPAATIAACLMVVVYLRALRSGRQPTRRASFKTRLTEGRRAVVPMLMPVLLIGGIVSGFGTPTEVSSFAVAYGLLIGLFLYRQISARALWQLLTEASLLSGMIFFTFCGATLFSWGAVARRRAGHGGLGARLARRECLPAGGDPDHRSARRGARKHRHHHHSRPAAAAGGDPARDQPAAIQHRADRGVRDRVDHPASRPRPLHRLRGLRDGGGPDRAAARRLPCSALPRTAAGGGRAVAYAGPAERFPPPGLNTKTNKTGRNTMNATRRTLLHTTLAGAFAAALPDAVRAQASRHGVVRIRYAHSAPTTHGWHLWGVQFKTVLEQKSDGKIRVQIFPNAQMGNEQDIAQAVRLGSLETAAVGVALMNWVPDMSITDAPFLFHSRQQAYAALDGALGTELKTRALAKGFRIVGWNDLGFRCMTNSKHPINTAHDMADLKMRVPDSKSYNAMMQAMGATVTAIDLSELYLALSQGVADGQETPPSVVVSNKYYEVQKYISKTDHVLTNAASIINPAFFDGLTKDQQDLVLAAGDDATNWLRDYTQKDEANSYTTLKGKGMQVNLTPDRESFQAACSGVIAKFPDLFRPDLVKLAQSAPA